MSQGQKRYNTVKVQEAGSRVVALSETRNPPVFVGPPAELSGVSAEPPTAGRYHSFTLNPTVTDQNTERESVQKSQKINWV